LSGVDLVKKTPALWRSSSLAVRRIPLIALSDVESAAGRVNKLNKNTLSYLGYRFIKTKLIWFHL